MTKLPKSSRKPIAQKGGVQSSGLSVGEKALAAKVPRPLPAIVGTGHGKKPAVSTVVPCSINLLESSSSEEDGGSPNPHQNRARRLPSPEMRLKSSGDVDAGGMFWVLTLFRVAVDTVQTELISGVKLTRKVRAAWGIRLSC
jgi:hypothetical protein